MTLLHEAVDEKKFDTRMIERNLTRGVITADEADKVSKKLADDSENAAWTSLESLQQAEE